MKAKPPISPFRLLVAFLFLFCILIVYLIWHSQQKVNVLDRELKQNQISQ